MILQLTDARFQRVSLFLCAALALSRELVWAAEHGAPRSRCRGGHALALCVGSHRGLRLIVISVGARERGRLALVALRGADGVRMAAETRVARRAYCVALDLALFALPSAKFQAKSEPRVRTEDEIKFAEPAERWRKAP